MMLQQPSSSNWRRRTLLRLSGRSTDPAPEQKSQREVARAVFRRFFTLLRRSENISSDVAAVIKKPLGPCP